MSIDKDIICPFISISSTCHRSVMGPFTIIDRNIMGPFISICSTCHEPIDRDIMGPFISISSTRHRSVMGPFIIIDPFRLMGPHGLSHTHCMEEGGRRQECGARKGGGWWDPVRCKPHFSCNNDEQN
jgi:hypothetical protein